MKENLNKFTIAPGLPYLITYVRKFKDFKILNSVH